MFISKEQKTKLPSFESQNIGFHGDVVNSKIFYTLHYFIICTLHIRMYKPLDYVYFTHTNLNIICTNMK